jgi:lichenan operon transcriptional antiterminator
MLTRRMQRILRELMGARAPVTGKYLADVNRVTVRTIRKDIKHLDELLSQHGARVESLMGKGYQLVIRDEHRFLQFLQSRFGKADPRVPLTPEERVTHIIRRLLLDDGYLKLEDLADEIYVSKSTIQNDLKLVKQRLGAYDIRLISRPHYGLRVSGREMKLRFCMADTLFSNSDRWHLSSDPPLLPLPREELKRIRRIILKHIQEHRITISDISFHNLLMHIAIACRRIRSGHRVKLYPADMKEIASQREYEVAGRIVNDVEEAFGISFPREETAYIAMHLLGTKMRISSVEQMVDEEILHLVHAALDKIEAELEIDLKQDRELIMDLGLHLKPAIHRYKFGMNIRNPMLEDIKKNYPLAFEAGVVAGMAIEEATGVRINEDEVGYLALHLGVAIERKKSNTAPKRCLIVCASGLGTARLIYYKIKNRFGNRLRVVGTTEYYNLHRWDLGSIDFIISSIPISDPLPVPVVEVNAVIGNPDLARIESHILERKMPAVQYLRKDLLFLGRRFSSRDEVLAFMHERLRDQGLVDPDFLEGMHDREQVAPTAYGNLVAVPHPITPRSDQTFLAVCTLEKPVIWGSRPVQLVCVLSVKRESQEDLQSLYELLGKIIESPALVQSLLKAKSYEAFIDVLEKA